MVSHAQQSPTESNMSIPLPLLGVLVNASSHKLSWFFAIEDRKGGCLEST
jgi:hypothetical protein